MLFLYIKYNIDIMKDLVSKINEGYREAEFKVAFSGTKDEEGVPFTVTVLVHPKYKKAFKEYLEEEKDNSVYMAEDWNGDLIGED